MYFLFIFPMNHWLLLCFKNDIALGGVLGIEISICGPFINYGQSHWWR